MRPKERIPVFLKYIDWSKLSKRWGVPNLEYIKDSKEFLDYWNEYPDQRVGQVLINLGIIPDSFKTWLDEEVDILKDQGINPNKFLYWTSLYNKRGKLLREPKTVLLGDLKTSHIKNILKFFKGREQRLAPYYLDTFNEILCERKNKKNFIKNTLRFLGTKINLLKKLVCVGVLIAVMAGMI